MSHTPGPWEVFEGGNFVRVVAQGYHERRVASGYLGGPFSVAEMNYCATENYEPDPQKALANANLIAAVPDLLQALTQIRDALRDRDRVLPNPRVLLHIATTAITKAEARS